MSRHKDLLKELGLTKATNENNKIQNLLKIPLKDKGVNVARTQNPTYNGIHQIDLLFLPHDKAYKYALVAVDLATSHCDAEPLKTKTSTEVMNALLKIYKRPYLKLPHGLEVDDGTEFKKEFSNYFKTKLNIRVKEPGRHRQQAVVEHMNGTIGKLLFMKMSEEELKTNKINTSWVKFLPSVVEQINKHLSHKAVDLDAMDDKNISQASGKARNILEIGTEVRKQLDAPIENVSNKKLFGKFRKTDFRWEKEPEEITRVFLNPAKPPLYQLNDNSNVSYTYNQLQVVKPNEVAPKAIIAKPKRKNKRA